MKRMLLVLAAMCLPAALAAAGMNLEDVAALARAGVADSVIINQIEATGASFSLSTDDILSLKSAGAGDAVINAMIASGPGEPAEETEPPDAWYRLGTTEGPGGSDLLLVTNLDDEGRPLAEPSPDRAANVLEPRRRPEHSEAWTFVQSSVERTPIPAGEAGWDDVAYLPRRTFDEEIDAIRIRWPSRSRTTAFPVVPAYYAAPAPVIRVFPPPSLHGSYFAASISFIPATISHSGPSRFGKWIINAPRNHYGHYWRSPGHHQRFPTARRFHP